MDIGRRQATAVVVTLPGHRLLEKVTILEALGEAIRAGVELHVQCLDMDDSPMAGPAPALRTPGIPTALFVCAGELWSLDAIDPLEVQAARYVNEALLAGSLVCGVGGGVRFLATHGFLNGRKATVSQSLLAALRCQFPMTDWIASEAVLRDGNLLTCAGMLTAADAALSVLDALGHRSAVSRVTKNLLRLAEEPLNEPRARTPPIPAAHPALQRVDDLLSRNPTFPWTTCTLANSVYVSERHLQRLFREALGCGVFDYLQRKRLARAVDVLQNHPVMSLQRVAELSGFSSTQHLRRAWRKHFGANPSVSKENALHGAFRRLASSDRPARSARTPSSSATRRQPALATS
ncbi:MULTISPECIES: helix-turn-helix domain-containing protein [Hydrogenophaga]|uniref:Helix-turn-helix domain-containing protein n=1 Tax=Hydrogenophaga crocea TaxID=2716225 RepID=A0A6G8IF24_9BURK|nr:helix-turn-helix domain-containing protein [Hydrogenophaga crocea]QIM51743.1 helix-turn-helix domain-containing protein [Hydrogenophaga crocea]